MVLYAAEGIRNKKLGFAFGGLAASLIEGQMPDIRDDFPDYRNWTCEQFTAGNVLLVKFECKSGGIPCSGNVDDDTANKILLAAGPAREYCELRQIPELQTYFSRESFVFIVTLANGGFDWEIAVKFIVEWINDVAVAHALSLNQQRVSRAIPTPPQYSQQLIFQALWVLEYEETGSQGSAFWLADLGLVTCEHVVSGATELSAFHPTAPRNKRKARIVKANAAVDLAILQLADADTKGSLSRFAGQCGIHDHALVCGFPNYRLGDQGIFSPGVIIGTRQQSGIRRLLTNAPIVRGMSGGPVVGRDNNVIGICVTGADRLASADETEDKSIVPIDAIDQL
jgi:S1-C subfamily serine protease